MYKASGHFCWKAIANTRAPPRCQGSSCPGPQLHSVGVSRTPLNTKAPTCGGCYCKGLPSASGTYDLRAPWVQMATGLGRRGPMSCTCARFPGTNDAQRRRPPASPDSPPSGRRRLCLIAKPKLWRKRALRLLSPKLRLHRVAVGTEAITEQRIDFAILNNSLNTRFLCEAGSGEGPR